jgi:hypothetical protein
MKWERVVMNLSTAAMTEMSVLLTLVKVPVLTMVHAEPRRLPSVMKLMVALLELRICAAPEPVSVPDTVR